MNAMKTSELIKINEALQNELTTENGQFYENLIIYVRTKSLIRDEHKSEEMLLEILQDIVDAQEKGISAEEYFGQNPKYLADELIQNLPINLFDTVKLILTGFGCYLLFALIPSFITPDKKIDVGSYLIAGIFATICIFGILRLLGYSVYQYKSKRAKISLYMFFIMSFSLMILILLFIKTPLQLSIQGNTGIVLIVACLLLLLYLFINQQEKSNWIPFIPPVLMFSILGILYRVPATVSYFNTSTGKYVVVFVLVLGLFIQYVGIFYYTKKKK